MAALALPWAKPSRTSRILLYGTEPACSRQRFAGREHLGQVPRIRTTQHIDEGLEGRIITRLHDRLERKERGSQARARTRHGKLRGKGNTRTRKCIMQARVCIGSAGTANEHVRILDAVFLVHAAHETRDHVALATCAP